MASKKRTDLTLAVKVQVLNEIEKPGATLVKVAEQFGISKSQVGRIKQSKAQLRGHEASTRLHGQKRIRGIAVTWRKGLSTSF